MSYQRPTGRSKYFALGFAAAVVACAVAFGLLVYSIRFVNDGPEGKGRPKIGSEDPEIQKIIDKYKKP